jgi:hypothetical protein
MASLSAVPLVSLFCDIHDLVQKHDSSGVVSINGHSLDVAGVVAVARLVKILVDPALDLIDYRHWCTPNIQEVNGVLSLDDSVKALNKRYKEGEILYGSSIIVDPGLYSHS